MLKVTNYVVEGERTRNTDTMEFNYDVGKWGCDEDVARLWVQDEVKAEYGTGIEPDFEMIFP